MNPGARMLPESAAARGRGRRWRAGRCVLLALPCALWAAAPAEPSSPAAAPRMLLLDAARVGLDVVVVGERGTILHSTDGAATWHRSTSPTRATLTGISFATLTAPRLGWAVGHDAQILATADGGRVWTRQFQGESLQDSFLDVLALDAQRVIAVGAYGLFVQTGDGGLTWARRKVVDDDYHFNRLTRGANGTLFIAGEHGTLLRSNDNGATWTRMTAPYDGSFYGVLALDHRTLLAYGLRGRVFLSTDDGTTWTAIPAPQPALVASAVRTKDDLLVLGGQARALFMSRDGGKSLEAVSDPLPTAIAEIIELADGRLLAVGEAGVTVLPAMR